MTLVRWIDFRAISDSRGSLVAIEGGRTVPFEIKRVYYIYGTAPGASRGFHAHKALQQVAICLAGSCRFVLDDGRRREEVVLDRQDRGLLVDAMIWHEMHDLTANCVLFMLASDHYDEADYVRDYHLFEAVGR